MSQPASPAAPASAPNLASALYVGRVRHRRFLPRAHRLGARTAWLYLDLEEWQAGRLEGRLPGWLRLGRRWPVGVARRDLLGPPELPLDEAVRRAAEARLGFRPAGPIAVLTLPAALGQAFNPVSFYYCWRADRSALEAVLAEITNTPWLERHAYALDLRAGRGAQRFPKVFHVSPFLDLDLEYRWAFHAPGERLAVHMQDFQSAPGKPGLPPGAKLFDATLVLERRPLGRLWAELPRILVQPLLVVAAIYLHAAWLYLRRVPFYSHPAKRAGA